MLTVSITLELSFGVDQIKDVTLDADPSLASA